MIVLITLTTAGNDTGPFNLYSDVDGFVSAFETGISKATLLAGYTSSSVPNGTTIVRVMSNSALCTNFIDIVIGGECTTTTTTSSSTTTTTTTEIPPTTTTTTTTVICTRWDNNSGISAYYDYVECDGTVWLNKEVINGGSICAQFGTVSFISGGTLTDTGTPCI